MPPKKGSKVQKNRARALVIELNQHRCSSPVAPDSLPDKLPASDDIIDELTLEITRQKNRGDKFKADKRNERRQSNRHQVGKAVLRVEVDSLKTDLALTNQALSDAQEALVCSQNHISKLTDVITRLKRAKEAGRKAKARKKGMVARAVDRALAKIKSQKLKSSAVIKGGIRDAIQRLLSIGVQESYIDEIIHVVAEAFGITVSDTISSRSVRRISVESYCASIMQLGYEITQSKSGVKIWSDYFTDSMFSLDFTLSSDGTSNKNINYESRHITLKASDYGNPESAKSHRTRFIGITAAVNHTSETQLAGTKEAFAEIAEVFNNSPLGQSLSSNLSTELMATYLKGLSTDHSQDQIKYQRLLREWKSHCDHILRGRDSLHALPPSQIAVLVINAMNERMDKLGGENAWSRLTFQQQERHREELLDQLYLCLGKDAFDLLSEDEKKASSLFLWSGCCMHKEMNTVKYGVSALKKFWKDLGLDGPVKLYNRDNAAAANGSDVDSLAKRRADAVTEGGAIKLASLAGALFNHKDKKKGHQDSFGYFFERVLGYSM